MNFLSGQTDLMPVPPRLTFCGPLDELQTPLVEYSRPFKWVHNVELCQDCKWPYSHYLWPFIISVICLISPQAAWSMELFSAGLELSVEALSQKLQSGWVLRATSQRSKRKKKWKQMTNFVTVEGLWLSDRTWIWLLSVVMLSLSQFSSGSELILQSKHLHFICLTALPFKPSLIISLNSFSFQMNGWINIGVKKGRTARAEDATKVHNSVSPYWRQTFNIYLKNICDTRQKKLPTYSLPCGKHQYFKLKRDWKPS